MHAAQDTLLFVVFIYTQPMSVDTPKVIRAACLAVFKENKILMARG